MRMWIALCLLFGVVPPLAEDQIPPRGTELPAFETVGPSARQERCQTAATAIMKASSHGAPRETIWSLTSCEVSGVPALLRLWTSTDLPERDMGALMEVTYTIRDLRILRLAESISLDQDRPDLWRFAALSVLSEYLKPGSGHTRPGGWFSNKAPWTIMVTRRMNPTWVRGPEPITEEDLRALRPTLEELAAREEDPVRPIAEYLLSLLPKG